MPTSQALSDLTACVQAIEQTGFEVRQITGAAGATVENHAEATVGLSVPVASHIDLPDGVTLSIADVGATEDGVVTIEMDLELSASVTPDGHDPTTDAAATDTPTEESATTPADPTSSATASTNGTDPATTPGDSDAPTEATSRTAQSPTEEQANSQPEAPSDAPDSETGPKYKDPTALEAVYSPAKTFPEMTDDLGVDVTAQTVRKYMIDHGIHDPGSQSTGSDATTDPPETSAGDSRDDDRSAATSQPEASTDTDTGADTDPDAPNTADAADPEDSVPAQRTNSNVEATAGRAASSEESTGDAPDTDTDPPDASDQESASDTGGTGESAPADAGHASNADSEAAPARRSDPDTEADDPTAPEHARECIPDGIDCPESLTIDDLTDTVSKATTPYEVQRDLGLDRGTTQQLLSALDLLDLVRTRMDDADTETPIETIETRIAEATSD